jgi:hypothetical protein
MAEGEREKVYLTFHRSFVREHIGYTDALTGEERTFNVVTVPPGTVIDGRDMGGWEFNPLFVNPSRYKGEDFRDVPLLADRGVWLRRDVLDADGNPMPDGNGRNERETVKVMPSAIRQAMAEERAAWAREHATDRTLGERAQEARSASDVMAGTQVPAGTQER